MCTNTHVYITNTNTNYTNNKGQRRLAAAAAAAEVRSAALAANPNAASLHATVDDLDAIETIVVADVRRVITEVVVLSVIVFVFVLRRSQAQ